MSTAAYSEINFHITWHTKNSLPMITPAIKERLYHYITHKGIGTSGAYLHAIGGIETHIHVAVSTYPEILMSKWIGELKGGSSYYINHEVEAKALEWQRGYGIVSFGTKDLTWVVEYIKNQKEHHRKGSIYERLEKYTADDERIANAARKGR
jgi:putative transposase